MSYPVLDASKCRNYPFKPEAGITHIELNRLKTSWNDAVNWCEMSLPVNGHLVEWFKRERDIVVTFADFMMTAHSVWQIETAVAGTRDNWQELRNLLEKGSLEQIEAAALKRVDGMRQVELEYWQQMKISLRRSPAERRAANAEIFPVVRRWKEVVEEPDCGCSGSCYEFGSCGGGRVQ
jgi:hypothetical protein